MKRSLGLAAAARLLGAVVIVGGCGNSDSNPPPPTPDVTTAHGDFHNFVFSKLILPTSSKDFAIDLDGDGRGDNQMGNLLGQLSAQNVNAQDAVDKAVTTGSAVVLMSVQTQDATLKNDDAAGATLFRGQSFAQSSDGGSPDDGGTPDGGCVVCPDFSGSGTFAVDDSQPPATFLGRLSKGNFSSNDPVTTRNPVSASINIPLVGMNLPLTIHGAHVAFQTGTDPTSGKPILQMGALQGSIKASDIQNTILPGVVMMMNQSLKDEPNSETSKNIKALFDTGGCPGAMAGDGKIDLCELSSNLIIGTLLAPDVQIYDASGNYAPNKTKKTPDSLSFAIGFEAVTGNFARPGM